MARTIRKLTAGDASYLYVETPEVPMQIGSMAIFQLPDNYRGDFFEDLKAMIGRRLHLAPMLTWKLVHTPLDIDHPSWIEDEQFDIDRHIFRGALPAPSDHATLQRIVGWLHAKCSIALGHCGRSTYSTACRTTRSQSTPRCTMHASTPVRVPQWRN
jgi:diacylglycerol O-acyltransferase / wax synthase